MTMWLKVKKLDPNATLPRYETDGANGMDLMALNDFEINPGERILVNTGIAVEIPKDFVGKIESRSGIASKKGIDVCAGVVDFDYTGEVKVLLHNTSEDKHLFVSGDRIAQMLIVNCPQVIIKEVSELSITKRGDRGFGSTEISS